MYFVKEAFLTLQGEGANAGRVALFCRFAGCNLWSGKERHREKAICRFCDTDFLGVNGENGGRFHDAEHLADHLDRLWGEARRGQRLVVCTGGEPMLQLSHELILAFRDRGFVVAVETNGTLQVPSSVNWICVSPKAGTTVVQQSGSELKLVYPQPGLMPEACEAWDFEHFFLQPMDGPERTINTARAVEYCLANPQWRLSLQTHKMIGIA